MLMPRENEPLSVELISPMAMDEGLQFAVYDGDSTVGSGVVIKKIA
jgi:elongation factor Tu